jgi:glycosyltransferase 2 family protein
MKNKNWLIVQGVIGLVLGGVILFLLVRRVGLPALADNISHADPILMVCGALFIALSYASRAMLWKSLMNKYHQYRYNACFRSTMVGYLVNNILPLRIGDIIRGTFLYLTQNGSGGIIFGSLALERVLDISLILTALVALSFSLALHYAWLVRSIVILVVIIIAFFIAVALARRVAKSDFTRWPSILVKIKNLVSKVISRSFLTNIGNAASLRNILRGIPWLLLTWFITYWGLYFTVRSLGITDSLGIPHIALILCFSSLGMALPSLPASLGTYQAAFVFGALLVGLDESIALSASFLYQFLWVIVVSILGMASWAWEGLGLKKLVNQLGKAE